MGEFDLIKRFFARDAAPAEGVALGIGDDFNEELLSAMARGGGGQFYYVSDAAKLAAVLQREVGDALEVAASEVAVELWPSPGVRLELLNDFPAEWTGTHLRVALGDLTSEQLIDLSVQALLPAGTTGDECSVEVRLSDAEGPLEPGEWVARAVLGIDRWLARPDATVDLEQLLSQLETGILDAALKQARGNKTEAARLVGLTFRSLRYKLIKHDAEETAS
mgnify:CR=1 FL=1